MTGRPDPADHPLRTEPDDPPPPREQLPLPRRRGQAHLEPQLRDPGSAGDGTPFAAFTDEQARPEAADDRGDRTGDVAVEFRDGIRRGRAATDRPRGSR